MRKKRFVLLGFAVLLLAVAGILLVRQYLTMATATPLSQDEVIQRAKDFARANGLVGEPSKVAIAQMTFGESQSLLDDVVAFPAEEASKSVWVVVLEGEVIIESEPGQSGETMPLKFDNIYVVLDAVTGDVIEVGSRTPGHEITLPK